LLFLHGFTFDHFVSFAWKQFVKAGKSVVGSDKLGAFLRCLTENRKTKKQK
jgi:hypothetical protein